MIYRGTVKNGQVVFEGAASLPEGTEVIIEPLPGAKASEKPDSERPTLYEIFEDVIGVVDDLPSDMAQQHDHYLYGTPKR